jgi:hypothetical protein
MPQWREPDPRDIYSAAPADPYAQARRNDYGRAPPAGGDDGYGDYGAGGFAPQPPAAPQRPQQARAPQSAAYAHGGHGQPPPIPPGQQPGAEPSFDSFGQTLGRVAQPPRQAPAARPAPTQRMDPQLVPQYPPDQYAGGYPDQHSADPNSYHLGNYAAPQPPYGGGQPDQGYAAYGEPAARQGFGGGMPDGRHAAGYGEAPYGYQPPAGEYPPEYAEGDEDYETEYDEEPRRSRKWMIVAALVGSIGIGGGLAYGYKAMTGDGRGRTQVVKASTNPTKTAPDDRGGKRFANTDNKFMNRLQPDGTNPSAGGGLDNAGVRRVQTVTVGKDLGSDTPRTAAQSASGGGVPGMILVDRDSMPPPPQPSSTAGGFSGGSPLPRVASAPPSAPPRAIDRLPPPPQASPRIAARSEPPPERSPPARVAGPRPEPPLARAAPPGAAAEKARPTRNGYVAVLGYQRSQLEAMKMMADLQQQYSVLQGKQMEVLASDQSARGLGTIYRVVVGPAGAISAARGVCSELTQAGMPASRCYTIVPR